MSSSESNPSNIIIQPKRGRKPSVKTHNPHMESTIQKKQEKPEKQEKQERETCSICAEYYTPIIRRKIVCTFCNHDTCSKCVENYLLSRHDDAHCLHCHVNYSDDVLRQICTKTYLQQTFFKHRQAVLINRSRAQLPALQDEALRMKKSRERASQISAVRDEINRILKEKDTIVREYTHYNSEFYKLRVNEVHTEAEKAEVRKQKQEIREQMDEIETKIQTKLGLVKELRKTVQTIHDNYRDNEDDENGNTGAVAAAAAEEEEKKRFIRRCIRDGCQGFLSQAWKCGMCEWYSCHKCFAVKGPVHDSPHECTKEALETAALIRKNCKPCPKCGEQIEHGGGCSQMWCISCKTPWDWTTGKIVTSGPIHNPLFYEWQRRTGGNVPRNPADIPCGGYPRHWELVYLPRGVNNTVVNKYYEFFRICQELQTISQNNYRSHINEQNVNEIHIRFLLQDFDEKIWGRQLAALEKKKKRDAEIQEVFAAFHMVAVDLINRVQHYNDAKGRTLTQLSIHEIEQFINELDIEIQELIQMINSALRKISISYCYSIHYIGVSHEPNHKWHYQLGYKNFAHEIKKQRAAKKGVADTVDTVDTADTADTSDAASVTSDVIEEEYVDEINPQRNVPLFAPNNGAEPYDSDSDDSVASDIQAAIEASLQF